MSPNADLHNQPSPAPAPSAPEAVQPPHPQAPSAPAPPPPAAAPPQEPPALSEEMTADIDAQMDAAMNAMAEQPPARPAESGKPAPIRGPRVVQAGREHRTGAVVSVGPTDIFLEFGPKELGVAPRIQWPDDQLPNPGDRLEVVVDRYEPSESLFICSRPGAVQKAAWEMLEPGQVVEARVTGVVSGKDGKQAGLELEVAQHRAFMPAGQVALDHVPDLSVFVGEKVKASIARVERSGRGNIVLSRREVLEQERRELAEELKGKLAEGQVLEGTVRKIMAFGAFVDVGGIDGLIHVSDISHDRVGHGERAIQRYLKVGEKVRVQILKIDWDANRLSLGMKQIQADPFATAANEIAEGGEVTGRVTNITEFGAFVELAAGVEGLVHISELAWRRVANVGEVVKKDEIVKAKVLKIDPETRRISLSIKALTAPPEPVGGPAGGGFGGKGKPADTGLTGVFGKRGRRGEPAGRSLEEIQKESPELRRLREKFGGKNLKGGIG